MTENKVGYDGTIMVKCRICGRDLFKMVYRGFSTAIGQCCQDPKALGAIKDLQPDEEIEGGHLIYYPDEHRESPASEKVIKANDEAIQTGEDEKTKRWKDILERRKK